MELELQGIVLRSIPYGEKDAVVTILTKDGIVGFYARGLLSIASKNAGGCLIYVHSNFLITAKEETLTLRKAELIHSYYNLYESLEIMTSLALISEVILKVVNEDEKDLYVHFLKVLELLEKKQDYLTLISMLLFHIVKISGYGLTLNHCVSCGKTNNIIHLSFKKGGFLCYKCNQENKKEIPIYLKTYAFLDKMNLKDYEGHHFPKEISKKIIKDLLDYLKEKFGISKWNGEDLFISTNFK